MSLDDQQMNEFLRLARGGTAAVKKTKTPDGAKVAAAVNPAKPGAPTKAAAVKAVPKQKSAPSAPPAPAADAAGASDTGQDSGGSTEAVKTAAAELKKAKEGGDPAAIEAARKKLVDALRAVAKGG